MSDSRSSSLSSSANGDDNNANGASGPTTPVTTPTSIQEPVSPVTTIYKGPVNLSPSLVAHNGAINADPSLLLSTNNDHLLRASNGHNTHNDDDTKEDSLVAHNGAINDHTTLVSTNNDHPLKPSNVYNNLNDDDNNDHDLITSEHMIRPIRRIPSALDDDEPKITKPASEQDYDLFEATKATKAALTEKLTQCNTDKDNAEKKLVELNITLQRQIKTNSVTNDTLGQIQHFQTHLEHLNELIPQVEEAYAKIAKLTGDAQKKFTGHMPQYYNACFQFAQLVLFLDILFSIYTTETGIESSGEITEALPFTFSIPFAITAVIVGFLSVFGDMPYNLLMFDRVNEAINMVTARIKNHGFDKSYLQYKKDDLFANLRFAYANPGQAAINTANFMICANHNIVGASGTAAGITLFLKRLHATPPVAVEWLYTLPIIYLGASYYMLAMDPLYNANGHAGVKKFFETCFNKPELSLAFFNFKFLHSARAQNALFRSTVGAGIRALGFFWLAQLLLDFVTFNNTPEVLSWALPLISSCFTAYHTLRIRAPGTIKSIYGNKNAIKERFLNQRIDDAMVLNEKDLAAEIETSLTALQTRLDNHMQWVRNNQDAIAAEIAAIRAENNSEIRNPQIEAYVRVLVKQYQSYPNNNKTDGELNAQARKDLRWYVDGMNQLIAPQAPSKLREMATLRVYAAKLQGPVSSATGDTQYIDEATNLLAQQKAEEVAINAKIKALKAENKLENTNKTDAELREMAIAALGDTLPCYQQKRAAAVARAGKEAWVKVPKKFIYAAISPNTTPEEDAQELERVVLEETERYIEQRTREIRSYRTWGQYASNTLSNTPIGLLRMGAFAAVIDDYFTERYLLPWLTNTNGLESQPALIAIRIAISLGIGFGIGFLPYHLSSTQSKMDKLINDCFTQVDISKVQDLMKHVKKELAHVATDPTAVSKSKLDIDSFIIATAILIMSGTIRAISQVYPTENPLMGTIAQDTLTTVILLLLAEVSVQQVESYKPQVREVLKSLLPENGVYKYLRGNKVVATIEEVKDAREDDDYKDGHFGNNDDDNDDENNDHSIEVINDNDSSDQSLNATKARRVTFAAALYNGAVTTLFGKKSEEKTAIIRKGASSTQAGVEYIAGNPSKRYGTY